MPQPRNIEDAQYVEAELDAEAARIAEEAIATGLKSDSPVTVWATIMAYGSVVYEHAKQCLGVTTDTVSTYYPYILAGCFTFAVFDVITFAIAGGLTIGSFALGILVFPLWNSILFTAGLAVATFIATFAIIPAMNYIWEKIKAAWNWLFSREPEAAPAAA